MFRPAFVLAILMLAITAEAQLFSSAPPASATSPTADGRTHGAPASVVSPKVSPFVPGHGPLVISRQHPLRPFGTRHRRARAVFVPVPVFYSAYSPVFDDAYPSAADPSVPDTNDPSVSADANGNSSDEDLALRQAYLQGVRDGMGQKADSRYGQHYMDSRENARAKSPTPSQASENAAAPQPDPKPAVDDSPATVFIFKDGHQLETRNFAIMGQTLYDFSGSTLKKVQLADLDTAATLKANDDRGVTVKLP